jgi:hypothetical protein
MSKESIFHKLVRGENAFTQLLCNMMKRDEGFRARFLESLGEHLTGQVAATHLRAQVHLEGCGQADILIRSPQLTMIIEVKTEDQRGLTERQDLLDRPNSYRSWLEEKKANGSEAWLVFLVPTSWKYRDEKQVEIAAYKQRFGAKGIQVEQIFWDRVLHLIEHIVHMKDAPLLEEFRLLLEQRYGPIGFGKEEIKKMLEQSFPLATMLKLVALVNNLGEDAVKKSVKLDITKEEIGWYFKKPGEEKACWLYVGCWLDFWEDQHQPLCFGISDVSPAVQKAFVASLKEVYGQDPIRCGDYQMGFVPEQDLESPDASKVISPKINRIWSSMTQAAP